MKQILCYGDSNTWGLIPGTTKRYDWDVRWTGILQGKFDAKKEREYSEEVRILEEGLCGRTTIFEDIYRDNRSGLKLLPYVLESHASIDFVIVMLGTNDCKSHYSPNAYKISRGLEQCIDKITETVSPDRVLVISPIHLGDQVWREEFDPEFDRESVVVSKQLAEEYRQLARKKNVHFLAASDYVGPSEEDQEHMTVEDHGILAEAVYRKIAGLI